jgi:homoserine kinase type II
MTDNYQLELIKQTLSNYPVGDVLSAQYLTQGYANENLLVITSKQKVLFRICHQQPLDLLQYEVKLMEYLKKNEINTAYPLSDNNGEYIQPSDHGYVMIYEFIVGTEPALNAATATQIGNEIGQINVLEVPSDLSKENAINLESCKQLIESFKSCPNQLPEIFEYFAVQTDYLDKELDDSLPSGIVHGDIFPNNTIFEQDRLLAIIDFEEACIDQLLFDVGMTINGFCFVNNALQPNLLKQFLIAYQTKRKLTNSEWPKLSVYMQWCSHGMLSWHLKNDLLNSHNEVQKNRVVELMERTQWMRQHSALISEIAEEVRNMSSHN